MPKWKSNVVLDGGSDVLRARAASPSRIRQWLLKAYAFGDAFDVVQANALGSVDMDVSDFVQSTVEFHRVTTVAAKVMEMTAESGAMPDLHCAIVDTQTSEVLIVTDETSNIQLHAGDVKTLPAWTDVVAQPI